VQFYFWASQRLAQVILNKGRMKRQNKQISEEETEMSGKERK
jgi:hypothetical protein